MSLVYKYTLKTTDKQTILIPSARVLSVATQAGNIVVYALVKEEEDVYHTYEFIIHGTGRNMNSVDDCDFLGTVNFMNGALMFHVFYREIINNVEDK